MSYHYFLIAKSLNVSLFALFFLYIALRGMITRKPLWVSSRWVFALVLILLLPNLLLIFGPLPGLKNLPFGTRGLLLLPIVVLWLLWKVWNGYTVYGITDKSFRNAFLESLKQLRVDYTEDMVGIHLKASDLTLRISMIMGMGQIRIKGIDSDHLMARIVPVLKIELAKDGVEFDVNPFLFYLGLGFFLLFLGFFQWSIYQKIMKI